MITETITAIASVIAAIASVSGVIVSIIVIKNKYKDNSKILESKWNSAEYENCRNKIKKIITDIRKTLKKQPNNIDYVKGTINQNSCSIQKILGFLYELKANYNNELKKEEFIKIVFSEAKEILNSDVSRHFKNYIYDNNKEYFDDLAKFYKEK